MYFLYRILTAAGMFILAPYYAFRGWRRGEPWSALGERLGGVPAVSVPGAIWIHAVSVGEVLAAKPLAEGLKRRFPGRAVFVSTSTETGSAGSSQRSAPETMTMRMPCSPTVTGSGAGSAGGSLTERAD